MTVQLRRYQLDPDMLAEWVAHWRVDVVPLREDYGFRVLFAYADHANHQFVWALSYDGTAEELAARDREYHASPEWERANAGKNGPILRTTVAAVEEVWPIRE
jgi:NIPSNAP